MQHDIEAGAEPEYPKTLAWDRSASAGVSRTERTSGNNHNGNPPFQIGGNRPHRGEWCVADAFVDHGARRRRRDHPLPLGAAMLALAAPDPTTLTLDRLFARRRESDAMMPAASASPTSARTRPRWCQSPASENYLPSKSASPVPARSRRPSAASNLRQRRHSSRLAAVPVLLVSLPVDTEDVAVCVMANQSECCRVPDG